MTKEHEVTDAGARPFLVFLLILAALFVGAGSLLGQTPSTSSTTSTTAQNAPGQVQQLKGFKDNPRALCMDTVKAYILQQAAQALLVHDYDTYSILKPVCNALDETGAFSGFLAGSMEQYLQEKTGNGAWGENARKILLIAANYQCPANPAAIPKEKKQ